MSSSKDIDAIFDEIAESYNNKLSEVNAILTEARDLVSQYADIKKMINEVCSKSDPDENSILRLRETFYRLLKNINSINRELYSIVFESDLIKKSNQNTE